MLVTLINRNIVSHTLEKNWLSDKCGRVKAQAVIITADVFENVAGYSVQL